MYKKIEGSINMLISRLMAPIHWHEGVCIDVCHGNILARSLKRYLGDSFALWYSWSGSVSAGQTSEAEV